MQSLETQSSRPRPKSFETETETKSRDSITGFYHIDISSGENTSDPA